MHDITQVLSRGGIIIYLNYVKMQDSAEIRNVFRQSIDWREGLFRRICSCII